MAYNYTCLSLISLFDRLDNASRIVVQISYVFHYRIKFSNLAIYAFLTKLVIAHFLLCVEIKVYWWIQKVSAHFIAFACLYL